MEEIKYAVYIVIIEDTNEALEALSPMVASLQSVDPGYSMNYADAEAVVYNLINKD